MNEDKFIKINGSRFAGERKVWGCRAAGYKNQA
jgi:hypothetical protein